MKKKFGLIFALACLGALCFGAGCSASNKVEEYQQKGYNISVTYDPNGGLFTGRTGVSIMDLYSSTAKTADENGNVHFQLVEPTDPSRKAAGSSVSLTMSGHFFVGWYHTRHLVTNENGQPLDDMGAVLEEKEGVYYYLGTNDVAIPAYTYEGYWDFSKDLLYSTTESKLDWEFEDDLVYSEEKGMYNLTLYAAWVPNYVFEYYYQNSQTQEWEMIAETTFDYKATNAEGSTTHDWDTIWLPDWKDGAMNYTYNYENQKQYTFPKLEGYTFSKAYTDEACTEEITTSTFTHTGSLDLEHGVAINPVQKIYVVAEKGTHYKISTAEQLRKNANLQGIYEMTADLDFNENGKQIQWPAMFTRGEFVGQIFSTEGNTFKIKNANASFTDTEASAGGLFGKLGAGSSIENVVFENATFNLDGVLYSKTGLDDANYGLFAGFIDEDANVTNVTIGGAIRIGAANNWRSEYMLSLVANGNVDGITKTSVKVYVFGLFLFDENIGGETVEYYEYAINPSSVVVENGYVTFEKVANMDEGEKTQAEFYIGEY